MVHMARIETDVLVIGGGGAGCRAALEAANKGSTVAIAFKLTKRESGCTAKAVSELSAYSAAFGYKDPRDQPLNHFLDTVNDGAGLADERLVKILAEEAPKCLEELVKIGATFNMHDGRFDQLLADASTLPRAVNHGADTGREILYSLINELEKNTNVTFFENTTVLRLLTNMDTVVGALAIDDITGEFKIFSAKSTVLATGGACYLYSLSGQPRDLTGTGYGMAYEVGARFVNMEMIQFGPAIIYPVKGYLLVTKYWRLKPRLYNKNGEEFLNRYVPKTLTADEALRAKEFAFPFNVGHPGMYVDIAMHEEICAGRGSEHGGIYMDVSYNDPKIIEETIPVTFAWFMKRGIDVRKEPIEIGPVAQCFIGGLKIDSNTKTTVDGLYACGETEGTVHGAARPGGNMLAASQVFGKIAGIAAAKHARPIKGVVIDEAQITRTITDIEMLQKKSEGTSARDILAQLQKLMWENVSICRNEKGLSATLAKIADIEKNVVSSLKGESLENTILAYEIPRMLSVARLVTKSALIRRESRGCHYRTDYPERSATEAPRCIEIQGPGEGMITLKKPEKLEDFYLCD